jgi:hypothetical protein
MLLIASATEIVSGVENLWKSGLSLGSTCPSTILKLFVQQHHFAGPRKGIGMRIHVTFLGMYFCHAYQVLIAGDSSL